MTSTMVKICGLMHESVLDAIRELSIDQIGFMFAKSRRQLPPERAGELIRHLRGAAFGQLVPKTVGVFVTPTIQELDAVMKHAELDILQLHVGGNSGFCREVKDRFPGVGLFKVVSIGEGSPSFIGEKGSFEHLEPFVGVVDAILLDTHDPTVGGGTGKAFDWDVIPSYAAWARKAGVKLIVAGGLDPDNVAALIHTYKPDGVDVSSGVETQGVKDPAKIKAFVERVKTV